MSLCKRFAAFYNSLIMVDFYALSSFEKREVEELSLEDCEYLVGVLEFKDFYLKLRSFNEPYLLKPFYLETFFLYEYDNES